MIVFLPASLAVNALFNSGWITLPADGVSNRVVIVYAGFVHSSLPYAPLWTDFVFYFW